MIFAQPLWFWAFALLPLLAVLFFRNERWRAERLQKLVAARLQPRLAGSVSVAKRRGRFLLLLLGAACAIVAAAQPRWGFDWEERKLRGRDVLVAIDVSRSMLANDLAPTRLARARLAAEDLIASLGGDRVGLIAFAGTAFLQAPLTADHAAVLESLRELDPEIIPQGGTNIAEAIRTATEAFGKGESDNRALVIFTDGEELDADAVAGAEKLGGAARVFTVGVGSAEGTIIALPGRDGRTEYVKDAQGQIVKSRLDEGRLRAIAEAAGGFYVALRSGPAEMRRIVSEGLEPMNEHEFDAQLSRRPIERYQWPLAAGTVLLAASLFVGERRRRAGMAVTAGALLFLSLPAEAKNTGVQAYEREDYKGAADLFARQLERRPGNPALHFDLGAAAFKAGDLDKALASFSEAITSPDPALRAKAEYNLANTLALRGGAQKEKPAKLQEWQNALQHYDEALKLAKNEDAKFNRDAVQRLIEELQKEPPKSEEEKKQPQDKKDPSKNDKKEKEDGKGKQEDKSPEQKDSKGEKSKDEPQKPGDEAPKQPQDGGKKEDEQASGGEKKEEAPKQPDAAGGDKKQEEPHDSKDKGGEKPQPGSDPKAGEEKPGGEAGEPMPEPSEPKREGELKGANPPGGKPGDEAQAEAAEEAQAAAENRMTEAQATALLDSQKGEEQRVPLVDPRQPRKARVLRDW